MVNRIIFCLGSNVGDREFYLEKANFCLKDKLKLENVKISSILQNKAMLLPDSPKEWDVDFYNIAISADIDLDEFLPLEILRIVKDIEVKLGRKDRGRWSPREIDIDIAAIDDLRIDVENILHIPHKGVFDRDFFQKNINEIEPEILKKLIHV